MDPITSDLASRIANLIGIQGSTLVLYLVILNQGAKVIGRRIPNNATGFWGFVRQTCMIIGADPSSKLDDNTTIADVAMAAKQTPPIPQVLDAIKQADDAPAAPLPIREHKDVPPFR